MQKVLLQFFLGGVAVMHLLNSRCITTLYYHSAIQLFRKVSPFIRLLTDRIRYIPMIK